MFSVVQPHQYVAIRLPSDNVKIEQIIPNININLGKFGTFNTNCIIGRPFHLTFEILDKSEQAEGRYLRVVRAPELHANTLLEEAETELQDGTTLNTDFDEYGLISTEKSNVAIFDNPDVQKLTMAEIEALKADESGNAKELIARILASHSQLDQKTAFSLAKYTLRKHKKYMRRFTVLPLDVATLTDWFMMERDPGKVMEIRNEAVGLLGSWANVHAAENVSEADENDSEPQSRYLVVDDTGGLVVAALAERMGILYNTFSPPDEASSETREQADVLPDTVGDNIKDAQTHQPRAVPFRRHKQHYHNQFATSNTLTLVHSNQQPNLNLLRYFNFDPNLPPAPSTPNPHPLYTHLKCLSWLQLIDPDSDSTYTDPGLKPTEEVRALKSNARSTYYRKRRRWERCKAVVDETRAGGFNGLIIASYTNPISILNQLVPLLAGGAQIVIYSPHVEPLLPVADAYSSARRTAFLNMEESERERVLAKGEFPVDPTLTLGMMVQTARVRRWQVLPGRTHPLMMGKGGAEGYIASATKVLPVKGKIEARGKQGRSRAKKKAVSEDVSTAGDGDHQMVVDSSDEAELDENERKKARIEEVNKTVEM